MEVWNFNLIDDRGRFAADYLQDPSTAAPSFRQRIKDSLQPTPWTMPTTRIETVEDVLAGRSITYDAKLALFVRLNDDSPLEETGVVFDIDSRLYSKRGEFFFKIFSFQEPLRTNSLGIPTYRITGITQTQFDILSQFIEKDVLPAVTTASIAEYIELFTFISVPAAVETLQRNYIKFLTPQRFEIVVYGLFDYLTTILVTEHDIIYQFAFWRVNTYLKYLLGNADFKAYMISQRPGVDLLIKWYPWLKRRDYGGSRKRPRD